MKRIEVLTPSGRTVTHCFVMEDEKAYRLKDWCDEHDIPSRIVSEPVKPIDEARQVAKEACGWRPNRMARYGR
jgi:hypothetical protein